MKSFNLILIAILTSILTSSVAEAGRFRLSYDRAMWRLVASGKAFDYPTSDQLQSAEVCLASKYRGRGAARRRTPPTLSVVQACVANLRLKVNPGELHRCLQSYSSAQSCVRIWWGQNLGKPNDPRRAGSSGSSSNPTNLYYQEGQGLGVLLGGTTIPNLSEPDTSNSLFAWGISWMKVKYNQFHMFSGEAAIGDNVQKIGVSYGFGLGPSRGMFHLGFNVGAFMLHKHSPKNKDDPESKAEDLFSVGFTAGALLTFNLGLAAPGFWKGTFGKKGFADLTDGERRILDILQHVQITVVIRYDGHFTFGKEFAYRNGSSGYVLLGGKW